MFYKKMLKKIILFILKITQELRESTLVKKIKLNIKKK